MKKTLSEMSLEELWRLFPIKLSSYNPEWKEWYAHEESLIIKIIGKENIQRINHIGSTSVEGLISKPTIDILIEIQKNTDTKKLTASMKNSGYIFDPQPKNPPPHMMFMKGYTENGFEEKVFHIHIRYSGDWNELYFRDYLKKHTETARQYETLKIKLKEKFEHNRDAYTAAKTEFILKITFLAKSEFAGRYTPRALQIK
ncbi:MAG: GrpB family protein [Endomicrobiaceae bacterium]